MGEYATKIEDEEGKTKWQATDGKTYKTRSGAWKWSKKLVKDSGSTPTTESEQEATEEAVPSSSPPPEPEKGGVEWASFDFSDEGDYPTETVPAVLKRIRPAGAPGTKKSKKQVEAEQQTSIGTSGGRISKQ